MRTDTDRQLRRRFLSNSILDTTITSTTPTIITKNNFLKYSNIKAAGVGKKNLSYRKLHRNCRLRYALGIHVISLLMNFMCLVQILHSQGEICEFQ